MAARRKLSVIAQATKKYIWVRHWVKGTFLLLLCMFASICGTMTFVKQMSTKDRLERKKYMGVWRWGSELTARMMSRFPNTVIRYMERKSPKMRGYNSGSSENPIRRNCETPVMFLGSILWK